MQMWRTQCPKKLRQFSKYCWPNPDLLNVQNFTSTELKRTKLTPSVCEFCQNFNRDKMPYLIKYTFTVQFSILDCTRQFIELTTVLLFNELLRTKKRQIWTKKSINDKSPND